MRSLAAVALSVLVTLALGSAAFADVRVSMRDGQVSIVATDATVAEILSEWARIGQTRIVNAERTSSDRVTIELDNVSERTALDVLLRGTSGYIVAAREVAVPNASLFDRIVVMPPSVAPKPTSVATSPAHVTATASSQTPSYEAPARRTLADTPQPAAEPANYETAAVSDTNDEQPASSAAGAVAPASPSAQQAFRSRRALETADPRDFRLPTQTQGGPPIVPATGVRPVNGVATPGLIVQPPRPPRVPGQPPTVPE